MAPPVRPCGIIKGRDLGSGQMRHEQEQKKIRRDMQIEIDETMHEKAAACDQPGELQSASKGMIQLAQSHQGLAEKDAQEPSATKPSEKAGLRQGLEVVVVRVVDNLSIVERFVREIDDLQGAEAGARERVSQKDAPGIPTHGSALSHRRFERLEGRKSLQDLANAKPGDHEQRQK